MQNEGVSMFSGVRFMLTDDDNDDEEEEEQIFTFHRRRFVDEEISIPDDREIHREVSSLVALVPILQRYRDG